MSQGLFRIKRRPPVVPDLEDTDEGDVTVRALREHDQSVKRLQSAVDDAVAAVDRRRVAP